MKQTIDVAMAGGGTGGHIVPALAVALELRARGHRPFFIGTRSGMEARLVPDAGYEIEWIEIGQFNRAGAVMQVKTALLLPMSIFRALRILRRRKTRAVFSMGGYVAAPVVIAAVLLGIPVVAMEPNAIPGMVNRRLGRAVTRALLSFPEAAGFFPPGRAEVTGVPVRQAFFDAPEKPVGSPFSVLVTGGSRGSRTLNTATRDGWPLFAESGRKVEVMLQCGKEMEAELSESLVRSGAAGTVKAFVSDMPSAFASADLVVCRSGASTVAELAAAGKPAILVPFPFATDDHQMKNAEAMAAAGAARVVRDAEMTGARLFDEVTRLADDPAALKSLAQAMREFAKPHAAQRAAKVLEEVALG